MTKREQWERQRVTRTRWEEFKMAWEIASSVMNAYQSNKQIQRYIDRAWTIADASEKQAQVKAELEELVELFYTEYEEADDGEV